MSHALSVVIARCWVVLDLYSIRHFDLVNMSPYKSFYLLEGAVCFTVAYWNDVNFGETTNSDRKGLDKLRRAFVA